jgi:hypothetical protein
MMRPNSKKSSARPFLTRRRVRPVGDGHPTIRAMPCNQPRSAIARELWAMRPSSVAPGATPWRSGAIGRRLPPKIDPWPMCATPWTAEPSKANRRIVRAPRSIARSVGPRIDIVARTALLKSIESRANWCRSRIDSGSGLRQGAQAAGFPYLHRRAGGGSCRVSSARWKLRFSSSAVARSSGATTAMVRTADPAAATAPAVSVSTRRSR